MADLGRLDPGAADFRLLSSAIGPAPWPGFTNSAPHGPRS